MLHQLSLALLFRMHCKVGHLHPSLQITFSVSPLEHICGIIVLGALRLRLQVSLQLTNTNHVQDKCMHIVTALIRHTASTGDLHSKSLATTDK